MKVFVLTLILVILTCRYGAHGDAVPAGAGCPKTGGVTRVGAFPRPQYCTHFFKCEKGKSTLEACPAGMHFSDTISTCDLPGRSKCA